MLYHRSGKIQYEVYPRIEWFRWQFDSLRRSRIKVEPIHSLLFFLLLYNFLKDQTRVFLCCTRPYLRNVHYASVKEYFVNDALLWDSSMVWRFKTKELQFNASSQEALFNEYLSKYDLKWFCIGGKNISKNLWWRKSKLGRRIHHEELHSFHWAIK